MTALKAIRSAILVALMGILVITTTACNTIEGAGKDTQKAGEKIENAADRNK